MQAHLEENLDEDSAARGGVVFSDANCVKHSPTDGVCRQQMCEELCHVPELVGLESVHECILLPETLLVKSLPALMVTTVALSQEPIVPAEFLSDQSSKI